MPKEGNYLKKRKLFLKNVPYILFSNKTKSDSLIIKRISYFFRASALESEHTRLSNQVAELETSNGQLKIELDSESKNRKSETETLAKKLADSLKQLETAKQKVLDADNEVSVLKRKNQASLRELTRELKECQRRLEQSQTQNHLRISSPSGK